MTKNLWTRDELLIALNLYYKFPYGQFHTNNPVIIEVAEKLQRTPSALVMKLCNFGSLDPRHQLRGVQGLKGIGGRGEGSGFFKLDWGLIMLLKTDSV